MMSACWVHGDDPSKHRYASVAGVLVLIHRAVYEALVGPIAPGNIVHHKCETPARYNPRHLRSVTRKEHAAEHGLSGWAAIHAAQTTCKNGHPFDGVGHNGQRTCSTCHRKATREYSRRKRAQQKELAHA